MRLINYSKLNEGVLSTIYDMLYEHYIIDSVGSRVSFIRLLIDNLSSYNKGLVIIDLRQFVSYYSLVLNKTQIYIISRNFNNQKAIEVNKILRNIVNGTLI